MIRNVNFWISMAVFQVLFGLAVFLVTRAYYVGDTASVRAHPPIPSQPASGRLEGITESDIARFVPSAADESMPDDPVELSRRANEFFSNSQYERAADAYGRLLAFGPNNVEILNNLGLTLHYLGRSDEALERLNEGIAADPDNQRIWLTLGFVNSQLGNAGEAREALTTATRIGSDESIRQSAMRMLEELP